jgi:5-methyltetrahydrofolate--homocysteine methyltransferase
MRGTGDAVAPAASKPGFTLLRAPYVGLGLTGGSATTPAASVSGLIFAHPDGRHFSIGKIDRD